MQIHELNNYVGSLGASAFLPIDNGQDTGKLAFTDLFASDSTETLWTGTIRDENDTATLAKDISGYKFIDVYVTGIDCRCLRFAVGSIPNPIQITTPNYYAVSSTLGLNVYKTQMTISGTAVTITSVKAYSWEYGSAPQETNVSNSPVRITRVDGVITPGNTKGVVEVKQVTLAAADWADNEQTVTVADVLTSNTVIISPDPTNSADYTSAGIICTAQANNSLTFSCTTTPTSDIVVNVAIIG